MTTTPWSTDIIKSTFSNEQFHMQSKTLLNVNNMTPIQICSTVNGNYIWLCLCRQIIIRPGDQERRACKTSLATACKGKTYLWWHPWSVDVVWPIWCEGTVRIKPATQQWRQQFKNKPKEWQVTTKNIQIYYSTPPPPKKNRHKNKTKKLALYWRWGRESEGSEIWLPMWVKSRSLEKWKLVLNA